MAESTNRIRTLRTLRRWSTEKLGERAGTTGATISRLELGRQGLTTEWLTRIAAALQVRPVDLLEEDDSSVYVMVIGDLTRKYAEMPEREDGIPMRIPAFHPVLMKASLVGFRDGEDGWLIGDSLPSGQPFRFGVKSIIFVQDGKQPGEFSLRTYERSESGGIGYVAETGDPALRWLRDSDKRIQHVWRIVAELKIVKQ